MESSQGQRLKINYTIITKVLSVKEEIKTLSVHKINDQIVMEQVNLGWFVHFEGSWEKLSFGSSKPAFIEGDTVKITFERITDAQSSKPSK